MSLVVNHNLMAMTAARNLGTAYGNLATSTQRLSSGLRVNSAADDAAGLAIRELMRSDIAVLNQGIRNASDAISMIQTAEGAMSVIDEKLIRMKELAEQAATGTYTTAQREIMNSEYQAMAAEIDRIANATDFNGVKLLDGSLSYQHAGSGLKVHFGTGNDAAEDYYYLNIGDMRATEVSGLRVGNSDDRDVIRTTALNATSANDALEDAASGTDGWFGLRFSEDFDLESPGDATWTNYGFVDVDASQDTLNTLVADINKGRAATGSMTFGTFTSATANLQVMTVNGQVFTCSSTGADSYDATAGTGTIAMTNVGSAASIAADVADFINTRAASIGVVLNGSGTTMSVTSYAFGVEGNSINTVSGSSVATMGQATLSHGGENPLTAAVFYDEGNEQYELEISMNRGGEKYQVQVFNFSASTASGNGIDRLVGGRLSGTSVGVSNVPTGLGDSDYASMDEVDEWVSAQEGSGRTDWDGNNILTQSAAQHALSAMDVAINNKDRARAQLGALQNRLENTITNLQIQAENLQAAESRISDVDVAQEMTTFTTNNILAQSATAMLAQANSLPQLALQLMG